MNEYDSHYALEQIRRSRQPVRRAIKYFFLNSIRKDIIGPTVDFGCGACQLLRYLPEGSIGLEVNEYLVDKMRGDGMEILLTRQGDYTSFIASVNSGEYSCLVMSHILEHIEDSARVLRKIMKVAHAKKIKRIILVLPGLKGYQSDSTHKTFVDMDYIVDNGLYSCEGYRILKKGYFPVNIRKMGNYFKYNELKIVYEIQQ